MKSIRNIPEWVKPENMRWGAYQWENKVHFRRMGGPHAPFWCNTEFLDDYFDRLYSAETLESFKKMGINVIATSFYKGYGFEVEKEEMSRQKDFVELCHRHEMKVLGYINSNACYYEMLCKEVPGVKNRLILDRAGNWAHPNNSYYPHKACLCFSHRENIEWLKTVSGRCIEAGYDGIHFDMCYQGQCCCSNCTQQFREYLEKNVTDKSRLGFLGFEHVIIPDVLPVSEWDKKLGHVEMVTDPMAQEWIKFNAERFAAVRREIYTHIKQLAPSKAVILNAVIQNPSCGCEPILLKDGGDCFYIESNFPYALDDGNIRTSVFNYKYIEAMNSISIPTQWLMKDDKVALPETINQIAIGTLEGAVYGGVPSNTWSSRTTGGKSLHLDNTPLTNKMTEILTFLTENKHLYAGAKSLPTVTIIASRDAIAYDKSDIPHKSLKSICYTLQRSNIPFRIIFDTEFDSLCSETKLIILSNVMALSEESAEKVKKFVRNDGKLLMTGESGMYNEHVLLRAENIFSDILENPNVCQLSPAPELTVDEAFYPEIWGLHITNFPKEKEAILNTIHSLIAADIPFTGDFSDGLFIECRKNNDGKLIMHLLNFQDSPARISLRMNPAFGNLSGLKQYGEKVDIKDGLIYGQISDYSVLEFDLENRGK